MADFFRINGWIYLQPSELESLLKARKQYPVTEKDLKGALS